ncbi:unnamed protein product [Symbiodinium natans]|uniref:RanBP2-type domain-containing protein n=1 Tax=Symbiodinium natans TaxID=878477 RepID=A0A812HUQ0_9DINO|nr:unnamed protein product [Symbiodinium natans]
MEPMPKRRKGSASGLRTSTAKRLRAGCSLPRVASGSPGEVVCHRCTLQNPTPAQCCAACGASLADWTCPVCTLINAPAVDCCAACDTPRKGVRAQLLPQLLLPTMDSNCVVLPPQLDLAPRVSLVFLHGFCNTAEMYSESEAFTLFRCQGLRVILPTAPLQRITAHGGQVQNAWYDYLTDHDGALEDDIDDRSLHATQQRLQAIVDAEAALMGDPGRVLLGGASQGCCAAFDAFARHPTRIGGFVGFVGHPLKSTPLHSSLQRDVPCSFFNAAADDTMQTHWVLPAIRRLHAAGWTKVSIQVADGADHGTSDELENEWMDSFLAGVFKHL